jgi:hypothetical protein
MSDTNKVRVNKKVTALLIEYGLLEYGMYMLSTKRSIVTRDVDSIAGLFKWAACNSNFWSKLNAHTRGWEQRPTISDAEEILKKHHERS